MENNLYSGVPPYVCNYLNYSITITGKSLGTVKSYYYDIRMFLRFFKRYFEPTLKDTPLEEIDASDVSVELLDSITLNNLYEFFTYVNLSRENRARARARKVSSIRSFYNYLETKAMLIQHNPMTNMDLPKVGATLPRYLELDQSKQLLQAVDDVRDYTILTILLNCGLRVSEVVGINVDDIRQDLLVVKGKGDKQRAVHLNNACISALEQYMPHRNCIENVSDKQALFLNRGKRRLGIRGTQLIVKKYLGLANLDTQVYSTHKLRHTAATLMYKYGHVDIRALQEILGHSSLQTTQIYTHVDNESQRVGLDSNPLSNITKKSIKED